MLAAELVGPAGSVVGVDRDPAGLEVAHGIAAAGGDGGAPPPGRTHDGGTEGHDPVSAAGGGRRARGGAGAGGAPGGPPELTLLDLLPRGPGRSEGEALADTLALAERAEGFGYARFWVAEHQGARSPALGCPELLVGPAAARTRRLRVGTAGVLLRYYSPLKVAETFRCLEALHPGRIDLGVARGHADDGLGAPLLDGRPEPADAAAYRAKVGQLLHFLGTPGARPAAPARRPRCPRRPRGRRSGCWAPASRGRRWRRSTAPRSRSRSSSAPMSPARRGRSRRTGPASGPAPRSRRRGGASPCRGCAPPRRPARRDSWRARPTTSWPPGRPWSARRRAAAPRSRPSAGGSARGATSSSRSRTTSPPAPSSHRLLARAFGLGG